MLLETASLSVGFDHRHILFDDLNLSLKAGKLICLMGPNGVGKSSLIRTLAGLQNPLRGHVMVEGKISHSLVQSIAVVLTDRISSGNMTAAEVLAFGRYPYLGWRLKLSKHDEHVIENIVERLNIGMLLTKSIDELSDGQMQMVMIARALVQDTPVILLDEPTAHLDLNNRLEMMKILKAIARKMNKGILLATHELDLALQTADEIWLAGHKRQILAGTPEDLILNNAFDEIFQFKGYDLRTGKVRHDVERNEIILIEGREAEWLWTKNAVERSGFAIRTSFDQVKNINYTEVKIEFEETKPRWIITKNNRQYKLYSIAALIEQLVSIDCESLA